MRPVREITAEEENFRTEVFYKDKDRECSFIKRDPIEPEPIGTIIVTAFRIIGYDKDCDGSLMAKLECINKKGESTGWEPNCVGLYPDVDLVITQKELSDLFKREISFSTVENEGGKKMDDLMIFCDEVIITPGRRSTRGLLVTLENPSEEDVLRWVDANISVETLMKRYDLKENL